MRAFGILHAVRKDSDDRFGTMTDFTVSWGLKNVHHLKRNKLTTACVNPFTDGDIGCVYRRFHWRDVGRARPTLKAEKVGGVMADQTRIRFHGSSVTAAAFGPCNTVVTDHGPSKFIPVIRNGLGRVVRSVMKGFGDLDITTQLSVFAPSYFSMDEVEIFYCK